MARKIKAEDLKSWINPEIIPKNLGINLGPAFLILGYSAWFGFRFGWFVQCSLHVSLVRGMFASRSVLKRDKLSDSLFK